MFDVKSEFQMLDVVIRKPWPDESSGRSIAQQAEYVKKISAQISEAIINYVQRDSLFVNHIKKDILQNIVKEFTHLISTADYYKNHEKVEQHVLIEIMNKISDMFDNYSRLGAFYLFRHAIKAKRMSERFGEYAGISSDSIKNQVYPLIKRMMDEVLISPKRVRIVFIHTELPRTQILAELITHGVQGINNLYPGKVEIINKGVDKRLSLSLWSPDAFNEWEDPNTAHGLSEHDILIKWLNGKWTEAKHQPDPNAITQGLYNFLNQWYNYANNGSDFYTIVIAVSHCPPVDMLIYRMMPEMKGQLGRTVAETEFCKAECGQFCFLGKWVDMK